MANVRKSAKQLTQDRAGGASTEGAGNHEKMSGLFRRAVRRVAERSKSSVSSEPVTTQRVERPASFAANQPTLDGCEVERVAYELFLKRGGEHGHDVEEWVRAEAIVRQRARRNA